MQYGRVILVVASATVVASLWAPPDPSAAPTSMITSGGAEADLLIQSMGSVYALTGLIALVGMIIGIRLRLPAGALLGPLLLGIGLEEARVLHVVVPDVVSVVAYALIGIYAGLLFDRASLGQTWRLLPFILTSTLALMAACAGLGWILAALTGTDYLTAYLATTPGGIDSVAIMAVDSGADASLVLAVQMLRLFGVVLVGAALGRKWSTDRESA
jgi:membrane AbrB-like protein